MDFTAIKANLEKKGYKVSCFETKEEAAAYLNAQIDGKTVGIGGSMTVKEMGLADMLRAHNDVRWHLEGNTRMEAHEADVYLSSVNGIAKTGEIVNIDGTGNRLAGTLFGHEKLYLIIGANKFADDLEGAIWRARNVASPKNAVRLNRKTPCAMTGGKQCYDCKSPERICKALLVFWERPTGIPETEVVLVDEELGY
jgi:L-lactate utilization protein LutB